MQLRYALLCDHANVTQDGKLNCIGIFDRLFATSFPALHRELFLVTAFETDPEDEGEQRQIHIQLINSDGQTLTDLQGQIEFGVGKQVVNQLHVFHDLQFASSGPYQFNIFFDDNLVKAIDLELVLVQPEQSSPLS